eukprot:scaffold87891_cov23-Tisochrysis_lutea.AAC.7
MPLIATVRGEHDATEYWMGEKPSWALRFFASSTAPSWVGCSPSESIDGGSSETPLIRKTDGSPDVRRDWPSGRSGGAVGRGEAGALGVAQGQPAARRAHAGSARTSTADASCILKSCGVAAMGPSHLFSSRCEASGEMSTMGRLGPRSERKRARREVAGCMSGRSQKT